MNGISHGATLVLPAPHYDPEHSLKAIAKESCDVIYGTPTSKCRLLTNPICKCFNLKLLVFVDLISKQRELNIELPEISIANTAGAICTPKLVNDVQSVLKAKKIQSIYGLTENTAAVFQSMPSDESTSVQECVGFVSDNVEVKVVDKEGNTVPFGQPGELCVRGYSTMLGYWNDSKKTKEILDDDKWQI